MFRFLIHFIQIILFKKRRASSEDNKAKNCSNVEDRLSMAYYVLLIGGLTLLFISMVYGGIYGAFFMEKLHEAEDNTFNITDYAGLEKADGDTQQHGQREGTESITKAFRSSHSHLSLFALIAVAVAGNLNNIKLKEKLKTAAAIVFLAGGLLFSIGIILQPLFNQTLGKLLSIFGGSLVIFSTALFIWGSVKALKK